VATSDPSAVSLLGEHGADTTKIDGQSTTPLGYAKKKGEGEMVRYLESKANSP
jgi:hypothetical protein